MSRRNLGKAAIVVAAALLLASAGPASAAYLYDWSSAQKVTDPAGDTTYPGRDIRAAYQAYSHGYLYFRIDLASAPSSHFSPGYANTYGLYIDSKDGGARSTDKYIPGAVPGIGPLSGIDFIVSSELDIEKCNRLDWDPDLQVWKAHEFKNSDNLKFQAGMDHGKTLEWKVKDGNGSKHIGNSFTWWAGPMLPGDHSAKKTYDLTNATLAPSNPTATPIPSAAWLLGSGIIGLVGLKRRRTKSMDVR
jgi:hypothetical protein